MFAEGAARVVAQALIAEFGRRRSAGAPFGQGTCYIEFGEGRVGASTSTSSPGPSRPAIFNPPSTELVEEKEEFGTSRRARWFGA